jgi:malate dehydrogenase
MELVDSAFDLLCLCDLEIHDDPVRAFDGVDVALLVGARPRSRGMERADLLATNAAIFAEAGPRTECWRLGRRQGRRRQPGQH